MRLLLPLLLALSLPAFAQHDHHAMPGMKMPTSKTAQEMPQGDSIGMPPMTMAFGVADKAWLNKLKAGDRIRFAAEMKGGDPVVSRYEMAR